MQRSIRGGGRGAWGIAAGCVAAGLACAAAGEPAIAVLSVGAFTNGLAGWTFNGGWEFKGAKGGLKAEAPDTAVLSADFAKGGSYVAMVRKLNANARAARVTLRAPGLGSLLAQYDRAGMRVLLCPLFSTVRNPQFQPYFEWLADLAVRHPCVRGVARQADYLTRSMLLFWNERLRGIPIEGVYWYDLKCDGRDPSNLDHNFGLVEYDTSAVRPGFVQYGRIARFFSDPAEWVLDDAPAAFSAPAGGRAELALAAPRGRRDAVRVPRPLVRTAGPGTGPTGLPLLRAVQRQRRQRAERLDRVGFRRGQREEPRAIRLRPARGKRWPLSGRRGRTSAPPPDSASGGTRDSGRGGLPAVARRAVAGVPAVARRAKVEARSRPGDLFTPRRSRWRGSAPAARGR
jgi:hypothetical protein